MRFTLGVCALAWSAVAAASNGDSNAEVVSASGGWKSSQQTTELRGSQPTLDTSGKAVNDSEAIDVELFSQKDATREALDAYTEKVSLVVGRRLDRSKDGAVSVKVDAKGGIEYTAIVKHSGDRRFDKAMVRAVKGAGKVPPPPDGIQYIASEGLVLDL